MSSNFNWDELEQEQAQYERYPYITDFLKDIGANITVTFEDDGNVVEKEKISGSLAKDSVVFIVYTETKKFEVWLKRTNYTNLGQLREIRKNNNNSLVGVKIYIERIAKNDPMKPSLKFEEVKDIKDI